MHLWRRRCEWGGHGVRCNDTEGSSAPLRQFGETPLDWASTYCPKPSKELITLLQNVPVPKGATPTPEAQIFEKFR